jgi:predicted N-acetyltransferase YhbS
VASSTDIIRITRDSPAGLHARLDDLLREAFELSLAGWRARGHWTADYTCHALVEDGEVLASAGVYRMEMLVRGKKQVWLQLGAVATRKARRGEGLCRRVLDDIFDCYSRRCPGAPFFLFANDSVLDFYPRFGFRRLPDLQPRLACRLDNPPGAMRRLAVDDPAVGRYLDRKSVV